MKILFTFTGFNDPYSASVIDGVERPGPILSLLASRSFDLVVLFATPNTGERTGQTAALIHGPDTRIRFVPLADPTDYGNILKHLRRECSAICQQFEDAELYVATASGTPQMHACWFLLTASGEIPAKLLQVRPPRFVTNELPLVEETIPSSGIFPRVVRDLAPSNSGTDAELVESALYEVGLVAQHPSMRKLIERTLSMARVDFTVLILGETGTGKELFAKLLNHLSGRKSLIALNCGAIPSELVESTLFGHVKGAFTGAATDQPGKFEQADGGTLFLDEIGELPLSAQVKLLRVLQDKMVERVGGKGPRKVDVRIVAATNRDLAQEVKEKRFREDLYYRLNPLTISIPPLRERRSEIVPIATAVLERLNRSFHKQRRLSPDALRKLTSYPWPGNVRELEGVLTKAVVLAQDDLLGSADLELSANAVAYEFPEPHEGFDLDSFMSSAREYLMERALQIADGNQAQAGRLLGISGSAVGKYLKTKMNAS